MNDDVVADPPGVMDLNRIDDRLLFSGSAIRQGERGGKACQMLRARFDWFSPAAHIRSVTRGALRRQWRPTPIYRHSRESGSPACYDRAGGRSGIPAFAGMTIMPPF